MSKNRPLFILGVLALIVVGALVIINQYSSSKTPNSDLMTDETIENGELMIDEKESSAENQELMMEEISPNMPEDAVGGLVLDATTASKGGKYVSFTPENLANSTDGRRVLFFYANWCPTCQPADKSFTDNQDKIPQDMTLIRVNYNDTETDQTEKDLAKKYGVTYQHTFVQIDELGEEVAKWNGGQISELLTNARATK